MKNDIPIMVGVSLDDGDITLMEKQGDLFIQRLCLDADSARSLANRILTQLDNLETVKN